MGGCAGWKEARRRGKREEDPLPSLTAAAPLQCSMRTGAAPGDGGGVLVAASRTWRCWMRGVHTQSNVPGCQGRPTTVVRILLGLVWWCVVARPEQCLMCCWGCASHSPRGGLWRGVQVPNPAQGCAIAAQFLHATCGAPLDGREQCAPRAEAITSTSQLFRRGKPPLGSVWGGYSRCVRRE